MIRLSQVFGLYLDCGGKVFRDAAFSPISTEKRRRGVPCRRGPKSRRSTIPRRLFKYRSPVVLEQPAVLCLRLILDSNPNEAEPSNSRLPASSSCIELRLCARVR